MCASRANAGEYTLRRARALGNRDGKKKKTSSQTRSAANAFMRPAGARGPQAPRRSRGAPEEGAARLRLAPEQAPCETREVGAGVATRLR